MRSEADTCRTLITPKLQAVGWGGHPHSIAPVILAAPQLLTTGLDAPTCRPAPCGIVLVRLINSMVEFEQLVGRGTCVRDDYGKPWFSHSDCTAEKVRTLCASSDELRVRWADAGQRADIIRQLVERGVDFATVAAQEGQPDTEPTADTPVCSVVCYESRPNPHLHYCLPPAVAHGRW